MQHHIQFDVWITIVTIVVVTIATRQLSHDNCGCEHWLCTIRKKPKYAQTNPQKINVVCELKSCSCT